MVRGVSKRGGLGTVSRYLPSVTSQVRYFLATLLKLHHPYQHSLSSFPATSFSIALITHYTIILPSISPTRLYEVLQGRDLASLFTEQSLEPTTGSINVCRRNECTIVVLRSWEKECRKRNRFREKVGFSLGISRLLQARLCRKDKVLQNLRMLDLTGAPRTVLHSSFIWGRKKLRSRKVMCLVHGKTNTSQILAQLNWMSSLRLPTPDL